MTVFPGGPQDRVKYIMTAPDGSRAVFNDSTDADYVGYASFTGLDSPDIREAIDPRSGLDGAVQGLNFRGSRPVVGTVEIVVASTTERNTKFQKLKRAMNALRADGTLDFQPDGGSPQQRVFFRQNGPIRRADGAGWKYTVQFPMQCADPYIYSSALHTSTISASPWTSTVTNQGDGYSAPIISVTVTALSSLQVQNQTTGQQINLLNFNPAGIFGAETLNFGPQGTSAGQVSEKPPYGAVDASGNLYVSDQTNDRVVKYNSSGVYQTQWGTTGTGNGQFQYPSGIAVDGAGKIWVGDSGNSRIQRFTNTGTYETQFGTIGTGNGQFAGIRGIAIDGAGNIFVVDNGNNRIQKLTPGTPPTYASQFGTLGSGNNNLNSPWGIVADSGGTNLWIVDNGNSRIKKVTNASPPVYVSDFGTAGVGAGQFQYPGSITRDSANNLFVADAGNYRIQKFNSAGTYQSQFQAAVPISMVAMLGTTTTPLYADDQVVLSGTTFDLAKFDTSNSVVVFNTGVAGVTAGGVNVYGSIDVANTAWWSLNPGDNIVKVLGGTAWTINWRDAWL